MDKLAKAIEQFELLKQNNQIYSVKDILKMSCIIRDNILNDEEIISLCVNDSEVSEQRRNILTAIKDFQKNLIEHVVIKDETTEFCVDKNAQIIDFENAKFELAKLSKSEKEIVLSCPELQSSDSFVFPDSSKLIISIDKVINNCENNNYQIVLLGEYQSGKTTTLDAFCGGLNLGAIGDGTKTSAVPLAVSYNNEKYVNVSWKTENELLSNFVHVSGYLPDFILNDFKLSDTKTCKMLAHYLEDLRNSIRKSNSNSGEIETDLQFIAICSIILEFYGTPNYNEQIAKQLSYQEIAKLSRFPKKLISRWIKKGPSDFSIEEIMFIFAKQIECGCPSQLLKDINGTIIDCPGLFANAYDSSITESAMINADAILYILPRGRQTGKMIDDSLLQIKNRYSDVHRKLMISNNLSFLNANSNSIYNTNDDTIKQLFGDEAYVMPYDAQMAYLGEIKSSYDSGRLDKKSEKHFIETVQENQKFGFLEAVDDFVIDTFESAWEERSSGYASKLRKSEVSANDLIRGSRILNLANNIKSFIDKNKAYSTIISNGAVKLQYEINQIRIALYTSYVEPYMNTKESLIEQWNERVRISNDFKIAAEKIVSESIFSPRKNNSKSLCSELSQKVYNKLFTSYEYDSINDDICNAVFDHAKEIKKLEKKEDELKKYMEELVSDCITSVIKKRIDLWNTLIATEQDEVFNTIFVPQMEVMEMQLERCWKEKFEKDKHFSTTRNVYYPVPKSTKSFCIKEKKQKTDVTYDKDNLTIAIALDYAGITTLVASCVAAYALYLAACVLSGPIGWLIGSLATLIGGGWASTKIEDYNRNKFIKKMKPKLKEQIDGSELKDKIREMIDSQIRQLLTNYQKTLKFDFEKLTNDRDVSISTTDNPSIETNCISAVAAIEQLDKLNESYSSFLKCNITYEDH